MPVETPSLFAAIIQEHLELKRRNAALEHEMPIQKYMVADPFENHPLFKSEEQARVEDTMDGMQSIEDEPTSLDWPTSEDVFAAPPPLPPAPAPDAEHDDDATVIAPPPAAEQDADEVSEEVSDESLWSRSRDFDWGD